MVKTPPPTVLPENHRLYVIGDIHGRLDLLSRLMEEITVDAAQSPGPTKELVFLGDYVDRGVDSKGVLDYLIQSLPKDMKAVFLRGNHDEAMLRFLGGDLEQATDWMLLGGGATLVSYGLNPFRADVMEDSLALHKAMLEKIPAAHRDFLAATEMDCTRGDYYFVHAGIRPGVPLDRQTDEDRLWIRYDFMFSKADHGKVIVHGHSILPEPDVQPNRIGIDTGAYATGRLTCLVLENASRRFLTT